ncbi:CU044_2847 family protein [Haliangium sp.]|uniref:CU044_2847 family protein n=1 Tax=Haliangium sp. TaxID=2663208 RepID=UPI003D0AE1EF
MPRIIQIEDFYIEVADEPAVVLATDEAGAQAPIARGRTKMGGVADTAQSAAEGVAATGERVRGTIVSVCRYVRNAMAAANRPDELKVKFGLEIAGEAGIPYLTKGSGKAVLEIEATWKNPAEDEVEVEVEEAT